MTRRLAHAWWVIPSVGLWITGTALMASAVATSPALGWTVLLVNSPSLLVVGLVVGARRPEVLVGQLLALAGGGFAVAALMIEDVVGSLQAFLTPGAGFAVLWGASVTSSLSIGAFAAALLLFPNGRLPSRSWRWLVGLLVAFVGVTTVSNSVFALSRADRPFAAETLATRDQMLSLEVWIGIALLLPVLVSLAVRARTASGAVRRQVGLFAYGVGIYAAFLFVSIGSENSVEMALADQLFFSAIPVAIWVAITRHGLYDLGRLVSRTVVYAFVIGSLAAIYLTTFTIFTTWLPVDTDLGVAASTLAAAAAFNPLRRRIQRAVDRHFFRTRYHAQEVFSRFSDTLLVRPDRGAVVEDTVDLLSETLAPSEVSVWIRPLRSRNDPRPRWVQRDEETA